MSKFWEPLREEYKWNPHGILNLIGSIGIIPAIFVGRYVDNLLGCLGFIILWYAIVCLVFLTYRYFRDK